MSSAGDKKTGTGSRAAAEKPAELEQLGSALNSAAIHFLRAVRKQDSASGLSPARLSALSVIVFGGPLSAKQLAAAEGVRAPSMTPIVQALESDGLVKRETDPQDARAVLLTATARGRRVLMQGRQRRIDAIARALAELGADEHGCLARAASLLEQLALTI